MKRTLLTKTLQLTGKDEREAKRILGLAAHRSWTMRPAKESKLILDRDGASRRVRGRWQTITIASHVAEIQCYARAEKAGKRLATYILGVKKSRAVPEGYLLTPEMCLARISDGMDYHPSDKEIRAFNFKAMIASLKRNVILRREQDERAAINEAIATLARRDARITLVTLPDSRRAGNCAAGTLAFAEERGINRSDALDAPWLIGIRGDVLLRSGNELAFRALIAATEREALVSI